MAYPGRFVTTYDSHPWRLAKSLMAKQNLSHGANVISNGDPLLMTLARKTLSGRCFALWTIEIDEISPVPSGKFMVRSIVLH